MYVPNKKETGLLFPLDVNVIGVNAGNLHSYNIHE